MDFKTVTYEVMDNNVALITLNRPDQFNAINRKLALEIKQVLELAKQDEQVRVLVITGAGKAFCAGGDLTWLLSCENMDQKREVLDLAGHIMTAMDKFPKPILAAVNGVAAGAGTAVALSCDIIMASEKAKFAPNFVNIGAVPDSGASWLLPRQVGYHKAAELMFTGRLIEAREALQLGLFNQLTPPEKLLPTTLKLAAQLAQGPQRAIQSIKKMLKMSAQNTLEAQLEVEASLQIMALYGSELNEGIQAFLQNRKPRF